MPSQWPRSPEFAARVRKIYLADSMACKYAALMRRFGEVRSYWRLANWAWFGFVTGATTELRHGCVGNVISRIPFRLEVLSRSCKARVRGQVCP